MPEADPDPEEMLRQWDALRRAWMKRLSTARPDTAAFRHPIVGSLALPDALAFLLAHHRHHDAQVRRNARCGRIRQRADDEGQRTDLLTSDFRCPMITLDRDAPLQIADQIVEGLRYEIGAGTYRPGERLPSTRAFGEQLGVSFHTVRKAYQVLAAEGALDVRRGGGYSVAERTALTRAERLERAAGVVQDALHRLVSLGLSEDEMEYAVEEGLQFYERPGRRRTLLFARALPRARRERRRAGHERPSRSASPPCSSADLTARTEAEGIVAPLARAPRRPPRAPTGRGRRRGRALPAGRAGGTSPGSTRTETVVLVTRHADAIAPLLDDVGARTGFERPCRSPSRSRRSKRQLETALRQARLVLYTPQARRRLADRPRRHSTRPRRRAHAESCRPSRSPASARFWPPDPEMRFTVHPV